MNKKLRFCLQGCHHYFADIFKKIVPLASLMLILLISSASYAQGGGGTCADIQPFCAGDDALIFANCNSQDPSCNPTAEPGPDYGCLASQPYPAWFYLQIDDPGTLNFQIVQNTAFDPNGNPIGDGIDVDFVCWGPFAIGDDLCDYSRLQADRIIDCSFSAAPIEDFTIPNAQTGEIYVLVITNYPLTGTSLPGFIKLQQISGDGSTNCDIVLDCSVTINEGDQNLCGEDNVLLTTTVTGPVETYEWYLNDVLIPDAITNELLATESGDYKVIANGTGCTLAVEDTVTVLLGPIVSAEAIEIITCDDPSNNGIEEFDLDANSARVLGSQDPSTVTVTFHLTQEDANDRLNALMSPYTNVTNPQIIYARVESNGFEFCYATSEVELMVQDSFNLIANIPQSAEICAGDTFPTFDATVTNTGIDLTLVTYEWVDENSNIVATEAFFTPSAAGIYTVTITYPCSSTSYTVEMIVKEVPVVDLGADILTCPNEPKTLTATSDVAGATYQWYLNSTLLNGETGNTLNVVIAPGTIGTQTYTVIVSNGECFGEDSIDITLYPIGNCVISQGISPNGDGFNDFLDLTFLNDRTGIRKVQIFNRLGTLIFEQNNYTNQWKGQTNDGNDLPTGTYFYVIDLAGNDAVYGEQATGWIYLNQKAD